MIIDMKSKYSYQFLHQILFKGVRLREYMRGVRRGAGTVEIYEVNYYLIIIFLFYNKGLKTLHLSTQHPLRAGQCTIYPPSSKSSSSTILNFIYFTSVHIEYKSFVKINVRFYPFIYLIEPVLHLQLYLRHPQALQTCAQVRPECHILTCSPAG